MGHRILVIGDVIRDIYLRGSVSKANEGDWPRIQGNKFEVQRGGAEFVRDSVASFSGSNRVKLHATSYSDIYRFVDEKTGECLAVGDLMVENLNFNASYHIAATYDATIIWDDKRTGQFHGVETVSSPDALVVVDSTNIGRWDQPWVNYIKLTGSDWDGTWPKNGPKLIATGPANVLVGDELYPVDTICSPVDTIGAGDVFTSVFVTLLLEGWTEPKATREAIYYASKSVTYPGCYMPDRDHARTPSTVRP